MEKKDKMLKALDKNLPTSQKRQDYITKKDIKDDYEFSRRTYKDLIRTGTMKYYQNL